MTELKKFGTEVFKKTRQLAFSGTHVHYMKAYLESCSEEDFHTWVEKNLRNGALDEIPSDQRRNSDAEECNSP